MKERSVSMFQQICLESNGFAPGRNQCNYICMDRRWCYFWFFCTFWLIEDTQGNNYFIVTSKEGKDVQGDTVTNGSSDFDVISIGNGFISDYSIDASVGALPTASVTV